MRCNIRSKCTYSVDSTDLLMKSSGNSTPVEDNINVVIRVRPISDKEKKAKDESIIQFPGNGQILVSPACIHQKYKAINRFSSIIYCLYY